jgi:hypothetical protein
MIMRRATLSAAGLAMATSIGLAGAGIASAGTPGLASGGSTSAVKPAAKLSPGEWTLIVKGAGCEVDTFTSTGTFSTSEYGGDAGSWAGGGSTIAMWWSAGDSTGLLFSGLYVSSPVEYKGSLGGNAFGGKAKLVKGAVAGC